MKQDELNLFEASPARPEGLVYRLRGETAGYLLWLAVRFQREDTQEDRRHPVVAPAAAGDRRGVRGTGARAAAQALVTEYDVGAAIGWHRDKAVFGDVIGISLLSSARFRLRRKVGTTWERASLIVEPRSAYLLRGPSRTEWEHSIPGVDALRYSITFRNFHEAR